MQIKTTLTQGEFAKLTGILLLKRLQVLFLILANIGLIIAALIAIVVFKNESAYMLIFVALVFLGLFTFSVYNNARRHYQANQRIRQETIYEFSDKGISISREGYDSMVKWNEIIAVRKRAGLVLLWQNKLITHVISVKDLDDSQWQTIQELYQKQHTQIKK
ncbi:YcxB family protein [Fluviicola sp.]|jgi:c-di-AMP phosphodiesterase-like protein|uniref:YcxB family protein n=1 Tax=Fluviicola sp. TaxID=1917219 RepID=UPI002839D87D|nr:YcxB family protein [Fluviicola sp.]MDR0803302.1 YcxB family protein [Fluviicola sp.]